MEQHPVPQNISSYQFHLVGDMTLKQFLELAGGVVVGVLFYATGLPNIIKWPLILISAGIGAALAFVPLEERPLEQWVVAFFRSVYSPTLFHWEKKENVKYFADESQVLPEATGKTSSVFANIPFLNKLETTESSYLTRLTQLFVPSAQVQTTTATVLTQTAPSPQNISQPSPVRVIGGKQNEGEVLTAHVVQANTASPTPTEAAPAAGQREVNIPQTTFISIQKTDRPQVVLEETPSSSKVDLRTTKAAPAFSTQTINIPTTHAQFSIDAAPPSLPTIINTISGQVMTAERKIIEGAVLEIFDEAGRPVRAMRTNKAGHFLNVTALGDGKYKILTEKEGFTFDPIEIEANGAIIQPIAIIAKA